jgi:hypothetical protein
VTNAPPSAIAVPADDPDGTDEVVARLEVTILSSQHDQRIAKQTPAPIFRFSDEQLAGTFRHPVRRIACQAIELFAGTALATVGLATVRWCNPSTINTKKSG